MKLATLLSRPMPRSNPGVHSCGQCLRQINDTGGIQCCGCKRSTRICADDPQGKELEVSLEETMPTPTWKALAHSDSTASIDADERIVADRVDR